MLCHQSIGGGLRVCSLVCVSLYLAVIGFSSNEPSSIELRISPEAISEVAWTSSFSGRYGIYISFDAQSVPRTVAEDFLNWKRPPRADWKAALTIKTDQRVIMSGSPIQLEPAIQSGHTLYFRVAQCELAKGDKVEVLIEPVGPPPFGGEVERLSVQPAAIYSERPSYLEPLLLPAKWIAILLLLGMVCDYVWLGVIRGLQRRLTSMPSITQ